MSIAMNPDLYDMKERYIATHGRPPYRQCKDHRWYDEWSPCPKCADDWRQRDYEFWAPFAHEKCEEVEESNGSATES